MLRGKFIFLFLDYDGTLAPIVQEPDKALISEKTLDILRGLSKNKHFRVAIISGRALKDIKNRIGLEGLIYAGNHGLEINGPKLKFKAPVSLRYKALLKKIKKELKKKFLKIKGVIVEDKGLSLSVHYRLVDLRDRWLVKTILHETLIYYTVGNKVKIRPGKKVLEIRPPLEWDKGKIVLWLLARRKFILNGESCVSIYIGDDITDEDAFKALRSKGVTIYVGEPGHSFAKYYLNNTKEVTEFMEQLLSIKEENDICKG